MTNFPNIKHQLFTVDRLVTNYQEHPSMLRLQTFKSELKAEKLRDKIVYQSVKRKDS